MIDFRFILNVEECLSGRDYGYSREHNCSLLPFWFLVTNHCSQLLICINAREGTKSKEFRMPLSQRNLICLSCRLAVLLPQKFHYRIYRDWLESMPQV